MALTTTRSMPLGFLAPPFDLPDVVTGKRVHLSDMKGERGTLVAFICNHCPYVVHILDELVALSSKYQALGFGIVFISSNDVERYPLDHPDLMKELAVQRGFTFPYLYDRSQDVAKSYHAECTPDFDLFDADLRCVYRGRFDGSTPGNGVSVTGEDLCLAMDALLHGTAMPTEQLPSMGCSIKWK